MSSDKDTHNEGKFRDILVQFRNLLIKNKGLNSNFLINSKIKKRRLIFNLREKEANKIGDNPREILLIISFNPKFYSIKSFKINNNH